MNSAIQKTSFGALPDGTPVELFTMRNGQGMLARVANFGTIITELHVPDRQGNLGDVVLGFDNLAQYLQEHPYFGCTVGRVANRIARGKFTLDGREYTLAVNNGPNHLHGGIRGFDKVVWQAAIRGDDAVEFSYRSRDGEEGYPGNLDVTVRMTLTDANDLRIDYTARTDKPTPVNLTNHTYFNLAGKGDVLATEMQIEAEAHTPSNANLVPTGEIRPVEGTPFDFRTPTPLGARFDQLQTDPVGYDTNYVLLAGGKQLALAARAYEPLSGRVLEVHTTQPGVQLYTGNFLNGTLSGKGGRVYSQHSGFCLETQHFPDSVNQPAFPSVILRPGQTYAQATVHKFSTR